MIFTLHGFLGTGRDFAPLEKALSPYTRCAAPDLPGHGNRGTDRGISLESTLAYLRQTHESTAPEAQTLLGYSLGGRLALNWVLADPTRFTALILISTSLGLEDPTERRERIKNDAQWMECLNTLPREEWLKLWEYQPVFKTPKPIKDCLAEELAAQKMTADADGWKSAMRGLGTGLLPYLGGRLTEIKIPVLLISGSEDVKYQKAHAGMSEKLKSAKSIVVKNTGHRPHLEDPESVASHIRNFVSEI